MTDIRLIETRYEALDAIGHALKEGRIGFAEATRLRDVARSGRVAEVRARLPPRRAAGVGASAAVGAKG